MRTTKINRIELDEGDALSVIPFSEDGQYIEVSINDEEVIISSSKGDALLIVLGGTTSMAGIYLFKDHIIEVRTGDDAPWTDAQREAFGLPLTTNEHMILKATH